jgi:hypothetical protein
MKKHLFSLLLMAPIIGYCQVGVGTNLVEPSAKFQIESSNKGFLPPRVPLAQTRDTVTISQPATGLIVYNTATSSIGVDTLEVTPGIYYYSGIRWERLVTSRSLSTSSTGSSDTTTFVSGTLTPYIGGGAAISYSNGYSPAGLGKIILPSGKWQVNLELYPIGFYPTWSTCCVGDWYNAYWLQNDSILPTRPVNAGLNQLGNNNGSGGALYTGDTFLPKGAIFQALAAKAERGLANSVTHLPSNGSFYINNTSGSDKTYYLFFIDMYTGSLLALTNPRPQYTFAGLGGGTMDKFYAVKVR